MVRYGFVIDTTRCTGCSNCAFACKDEFIGNDYLPYSMSQSDTQYGFYGQDATPNGVSPGGAWVIPGQSWMKDTTIESGTFPNVKATFVYTPCLHCDNAPCVTAATNGGAFKRPDGIVLIDPQKSTGQTAIMDACPYGRIYWNSALNIPQKCTMCAHLVDQGKNPKCVDVCPMNAITFGDLDDPNSAVSQAAKNAAALHPEYGTKPKVTYIGLP